MPAFEVSSIRQFYIERAECADKEYIDDGANLLNVQIIGSGAQS